MEPLNATTLERDARAMIALDEPRALLERFATLVRESGTEHERQAGQYIAERLAALGVPVQVYEPRLYLSLPVRSELQLLAGSGVQTFASRPPAFARSTDGEAIAGELCYVPSTYAASTFSLFDTPSAAQGTSLEDPVRGRVVLTEGFSTPGPVHAFERRGAIAQIYIHPGQAIHEGICTTIWGTPTPESLPRKPSTPIVCVSNPDGARLIEAGRGQARVSIRTWLEEGWAPCLLPVAEIRGTEDPDEFLLVHGHYDSWHVGIGDNATGNATLLELARVFHALRGRVARSIRVAFWPGHSTGRYAGSTWYADEFADDLDEWCIAQINIDSPGCREATSYEEVMWMAEADELCVGAIRDALGVPARGMRPLRAGDYSFNQVGPTGLYMLLSNIPPEERKARGLYAVGGCGGNTDWHTPTDLLAVADLDVLRRDLEVYVTTILRIVNAPLHPFNYAAAAREIREAVGGYADAAGDAVSFASILADLDRFTVRFAAWQAEARQAAGSGDASTRRRANATMRRLARQLVPLNYARGERFDHDPAIKLPPVPRLEAAASLAKAPAEMRPFIRAALVRERNKVAACVRGALREIED